MLTLESNLFPPIPLDDTSGGDSSGVLGWLQPTLRGVPGFGTIAPYGEASAGVGALVFYGVLALAAFGAVSLFRGR